MASPTQTTSRPEDHAADQSAQPHAVDRRTFLTYMVSGTTLTVAAYATSGALAPGTASAAVIPSGPHPIDYQDLGDLLIGSYRPTFNLMRLQVLENGRVRFELPRTEVGQGITTAMAMVIADEMDVPIENVEVPYSDARPELLFNMLTGGSCTMRALIPPVRSMAAAARGQLIEALANQLDVPPGTIQTVEGVARASDGRQASYGELTVAAAKLPMNKQYAVKPNAELKIVGRPMVQREARAMVTGAQKYAMDLDIPDAKPVVMARPPQILGDFADFDASEVLAMPGVIDVQPMKELRNVEQPADGGIGSYNVGIAIMAETFGQAFNAVEKMKATWLPGPADGYSDAQIEERIRREALPFVTPSLPGTVETNHYWNTLSHSPMETQAAVADVREDRAEIWAPTKMPILGQQLAARAIGLPQEAVTVHVLRGGGSFGSRLFPDNVVEAALASKKFGRPVKFMYTRNDDVRHGRKRGALLHRQRFQIVGDTVTAHEHVMTNIYCDLSHGLGEVLTAMQAVNSPGQAGFADTVFRYTVHSQYNLGAIHEIIKEVDLNMRTSALRQVYSPTAGPAHELAIDDVAAALGKDPVALRLELSKHPEQRKVIEKAAEMGNWGKPMAPGTAQGFGYYFEYKAHTAWLTEIDTNGPEPRVTAAYGATALGFPINPLGIEAMMIGGLADGITQILQGSLHIDNGAVREKSYSDFKYVTQKNYPNTVQTFVFPDPDPTAEPGMNPIGGAGEHAVASAAAAIATGYQRATGTKVNRFPINH